MSFRMTEEEFLDYSEALVIAGKLTSNKNDILWRMLLGEENGLGIEVINCEIEPDYFSGNI